MAGCKESVTGCSSCVLVWHVTFTDPSMGRLLSIVVISCVAVCAGFASEDPLNGDWKLASKPRAAAKGSTTHSLHIESDETKVLVVHKGINAAGQSAQW